MPLVYLPYVPSRFEDFLAGTGKHDHEVRCHDDVLAFVAELRDADHRARRVAEAFPRGIRSAAFKDLVRGNLYDYQREAHVRFDHAPHIRAKVECSTCHGNQKQQQVAVRAVNMDMGFCVNCHREKQASNDCLTCHY